MRSVLGKRFTWPGIHGDIVTYVKTCDTCPRVNASGNRKSKRKKRRIVCIPFESVCVDLVGPLPKGKRGAKYLFTYVCLASRWPDAIPMRTASATETAQCFLDVISRTGLPLRVLSDRGTIFLSKLMSGVCNMLGIDAIATSPYRPQSNGVIERMHGSLKPMLSKAVEAGLDWVEFFPLDLFALRQVPNRDVGFLPHHIVYGRDVLGPLDILYNGWVDREFESVSVDDWLLQLNDWLAVIHDLAVANQAASSSDRALTFNKHKQDKPLDVGASVLMRVPGMKAALQEAWEGPYVVVGKSSRVSYQGLLAVPEHRVTVLAYFEKPRTKKQLRNFQGSVSCYRRFIHNFADLSSTLTPATSLKTTLQVDWTEEMIKRFCELKISLCRSCVLFIPVSSDVFVLYTDASGAGVGGCLQVVRGSDEFPVGFFSRQLRPAEKNYSVSELECLAIVSSLKYFEYFVYSKDVTVITDHKPCLALMNGSYLNKHLLRFALVLQQFNVTLEYRPGKLHANADGMSRQAWPASEVDSAHDVSSDLPPGQILGGEMWTEGWRDRETRQRQGRKRKIDEKIEEKTQEKDIEHYNMCVMRACCMCNYYKHCVSYSKSVFLCCACHEYYVCMFVLYPEVP